MNGSGQKYLSGLKRYMKDEAEKRKYEFNESEWTTKTNPINLTPQQGKKNFVDCGVFTTMFADFITDNLPLSFEERDIDLFRRRICAAVLQGTIDYPLLHVETFI